MNKFTRSQMGKIMAYALSAAMAVTVVPTYMMKPLTVMAAETTKTVKPAGDSNVNENDLTVTVKDAAEAGATIKFYVSKVEDAEGKTLDDAKISEVAIDGTIKQGENTATVPIESLKAKADASDTTYTIYYIYSKDGTGESNVNLVKAGTIEVAPATPAGPEENPDPSGSQFGITADSVKQGKVLYDATSDNVTSTSKVCLYSKVGDKKAAYVLDAVDYNHDGEYEIVVPYSVPAVKYYMSSNEEEADGISKTEPVLEVEAATPITGVTLNATNTDIYYFGTTGSYKSNEETITVDLKGDTDKTYLDVELVKDTDTAKYFDVEQGTDKTKITVTMKGDLTKEEAASAKGKVKVKVYVAGRNSAYEKTINFKAVEGTSLENKSVSLVAEDSIAMIKSNVIVKTVKPETQEKLKYKIEAATTANVNAANSTSEGTDGVLTLKDANKKTVATFNIATGEFNAIVADTYTITVEGSITTITPTVTEKIQYINPTITTVAGVVGATTGNTITVDGLPDDTYAEYTVEDTSIATVAGSSTKDLASRVTFVAPGITKVNAHITSYTSGKTYNFETSGYIVTAPKDTEDFDITEVPNTEAYANELQKKSMLDNPLALQLAKGIVDGKVNASILSADTYEAAEDELKDEYSNYYDINATDDNVSATGLLFATYDSKVTDIEDPEDRVAVALTISDLQAKDQQYKIKDSVLNFVAEATVDGEVVELNQPIWLTVKDASKIKDGEKYTVYDDGEEIFTAEADGDTLTFQTDSFSVFSIVKADADAEVTDNTADIDKPDTPDSNDIYDKVNFSAHVQRRIGTDDEADIAATVSDDGIISLGTHGQSRRVEKITLNGLDPDSVEMTAHVQKRLDHPEDVADLTQVVNEDGSISIGTEHQSRRIEAFSMNLKGDLAEQYDVYYRVHAQNYGWLGWAKNGEIAGTSGHSFRLEGIEIIFVEKGTEFDESQYAKTTEEGDRGYSEKAAYMDRVVSEK